MQAISFCVDVCFLRHSAAIAFNPVRVQSVRTGLHGAVYHEVVIRLDPPA